MQLQLQELIWLPVHGVVRLWPISALRIRGCRGRSGGLGLWGVWLRILPAGMLAFNSIYGMG